MIAPLLEREIVFLVESNPPVCSTPCLAYDAALDHVHRCMLCAPLCLMKACTDLTLPRKSMISCASSSFGMPRSRRYRRMSCFRLQGSASRKEGRGSRGAVQCRASRGGCRASRGVEVVQGTTRGTEHELGDTKHGVGCRACQVKGMSRVQGIMVGDGHS